MMFNIEFTTVAKQGLALLFKNEPKVFQKAQFLIEELKSHPKNRNRASRTAKRSTTSQMEQKIIKEASISL